jgi:hypothetical protein
MPARSDSMASPFEIHVKKTEIIGLNRSAEGTPKKKSVTFEDRVEKAVELLKGNSARMTLPVSAKPFLRSVSKLAQTKGKRR